MGYLDNQDLLHGWLGDIPPAELGEAFDARNREAKPLSKNTIPGFYKIYEGSVRGCILDF